MTNRLFTSESVADGHPDKICDQISDAILDACLAQDPRARVAVEAALKGHLLCLMGEISTTVEIDFAAIARIVLARIGHADGRWGLDLERLNIVTEITRQSAEIASGVDGVDTGAGDQGLMFGFACSETETLMPLPIALAQDLMRAHRAFRGTGEGALLGPDAKAQVTIRYDGRVPVALDTVVLSTQHSPELSLVDLRELLHEQILQPVLGDWLTSATKLHLNPAGTFHSGGPAADAGLTGRKIIADTYGGYARHGGGAFSGKDATKVDRSAAYAARQIARDVVARGWADACEVQVAYAIGVSKPVSTSFETFGTSVGPGPEARYSALGVDLADLLRPARIIERLGLRRPIFAETAAFGHFGRAGFPWEAPLLAHGVGEELPDPMTPEVAADLERLAALEARDRAGELRYPTGLALAALRRKYPKRARDIRTGKLALEIKTG